MRKAVLLCCIIGALAGVGAHFVLGRHQYLFGLLMVLGFVCFGLFYSDDSRIRARWAKPAFVSLGVVTLLYCHLRFMVQDALD